MHLEKTFLFGLPLLNKGVTFNEDQLREKSSVMMKELQILLAELNHNRNFELTHEMFTGDDQLILNIYLQECPQLPIRTFENKTLAQVKVSLIKSLKQLPLKFNLIVLDDLSIHPGNSRTNSNSEETNLKLLMRQKQKTLLKILLAEEIITLQFPEMAVYKIDQRVRSLKFKIEYIHPRYMRIKILSDELGQAKSRQTSVLMIDKKIHEDEFFYRITNALRSKKIIFCNVTAYIDNISNTALAYEIVS